MIHVFRQQVDEKGEEIQPNNHWFKSSEKATKKAIREKKEHEADSNVYAHEEVKKSLEKLFKGKCAYCEYVFGRVDWEVEHFRPKGNVLESPGHPGYYWLAYNWENLYPSCMWCNQIRIDRPIWGKSKRGGRGGKADHFPLEDESTRAVDHTKDISQEQPLLVDPCEDNPENLFEYNPLGEILTKKYIRDRKKAEASIKIFHLRASRLRNLRKQTIDQIKKVLKSIQKLERSGNVEGVNEFKEMLSLMISKDKPYLGVSRYVINNQELFGID